MAAMCGLMAALGVVIMLLNNIFPVLTYAAPLFASLTLIPAMEEYGMSRGWMVWAVTSMLCLMLAADPEETVFYLFFGNFPMVRRLFEKIPGKRFRIGALILYGLAASILMTCLVMFILGIRESLWTNGAVCLILTFSVVMFDKIIERMILFYRKKIRPGIKK